MAIRPLRYLPDQLLRTKTVSLRARDVQSPAVQRLIDEMIESMHHYNGVGIASNQVGSRYRICIIQRPEEDAVPFVLVNPRITRREGEREVTEGCLSLPGYQGGIVRSERVWVTALDRQGKQVQLRGETGLLAQALEHETDHLDGVAFIDHLRSPDDLYEIRPVQEDDQEDGEVGEGQTS
uniref:Putative Polypeptide deformylase n=1 Tax=uncultured marine microorganism HF4000_APKG7H23 TaxID=455551 RepID=B3T9T4_9ZZZZ|nr:putative Polypeptide deformylase [uncultured marine microorganism HF4000_APKG7H23]